MHIKYSLKFSFQGENKNSDRDSNLGAPDLKPSSLPFELS